MAEYDGSIRINTEIDSKKVSSQMATLENRIVKAADKVASLRSKLESIKDTKVPTQEYESLESELSNATKEMERMAAKSKELSNLDEKIKKLTQSSNDLASEINEVGKTEEYKNINNRIEHIKYSLDAWIDRQKELENLGRTSDAEYKNNLKTILELEEKLSLAESEMQNLVNTGKAFSIDTSSEEYQELDQKYKNINLELQNQKNLQNEIRQEQENAIQRVNELKEQISMLVQEGKAFTLGAETQEYANVSQQLNYAENELATLNKRHDELIEKQKSTSNGYKKMGNNAKSSFEKISSKIRKSVADIGARFKKFFAYALGIKSLYALFRKIATQIQDGFQNLAKYSDTANNSLSTLKSSLTQLKNSLAAAFEPLLTAVTPILDKLINKVIDATNTLGMFFAKLTGQKTYTKAVKVNEDYRESLEGTASAAESASKALGSYDQLSVISADSGSADNVGDVFETVELESFGFLDSLADMILNGDWTGMGTMLAEKVNLIFSSINTETIKEKLETISTNITDFLGGFFGDLDYKEIGTKLGNNLKNAINFATTILNGEWLRNAFGGLGTTIGESINETLGDEDTMTDVGETIGNLVNSISDFLLNLFTTTDWKEVGKGLIVALCSAIKNIDFEEIGDVLGEAVLSVLELLEGFFEGDEEGSFSDLVKALVDGVCTLIRSLADHLPEIAAAIGDVISAVIDALIDLITDGSIVGKILRAIFVLINAVLAAAVTLVIKLISKVLNVIVDLITGIFSGDFGKGFLDFWSDFGAEFDGMGAELAKIWSGVGEAWDNSFLSEIGENFTEFWGEVWENIKGVFKDVGSWFSGIFKEAGEGIKIAWNGITTFFINIWNSIKTAFSNVGSWFKNIFETAVNGIKTAWDTVISFFKNIWNSIKNAFSAVGSWFSGVFSSAVSGIKTVWNGITSFFTGIWTSIKGVFSNVKTWISTAFSGAVNGVKTAWGGVSSFFTGIGTSIKDTFNSVRDKVTGIFISIGSIWGNIANSLKTAVKTPLNGIIGFFESLVNGIIKGINTIINGFNKIQVKIPSWVPGIGGNSFGVNIPNVSSISIPRLATGAVIPPNKEFMAVLGDQKNGTNIEAPLETIKQALSEVMSSKNGNGIGQVNLYLSDTDTEPIMTWVVDQLNRRSKRNGTPRFV